LAIAGTSQDGAAVIDDGDLGAGCRLYFPDSAGMTTQPFSDVTSPAPLLGRYTCS